MSKLALQFPTIRTSFMHVYLAFHARSLPGKKGAKVRADTSAVCLPSDCLNLSSLFAVNEGIDCCGEARRIDCFDRGKKGVATIRGF